MDYLLVKSFEISWLEKQLLQENLSALAK